MYQLKTVVGGHRGQERPRLSRRGTASPAVVHVSQQSPVVDNVVVNGAVGDQEGVVVGQVGAAVATGSVEAVVMALSLYTPGQDPPPPQKVAIELQYIRASIVRLG